VPHEGVGREEGREAVRALMRFLRNTIA
jgi:hypothetical protein